MITTVLREALLAANTAEVTRKKGVFESITLGRRPAKISLATGGLDNVAFTGTALHAGHRELAIDYPSHLQGNLQNTARYFSGAWLRRL